MGLSPWIPENTLRHQSMVNELTIGSSYIKVGVIAGVSLRVVSALVLVGVCCAGKGRGWQDKGSQRHGFF